MRNRSYQAGSSSDLSPCRARDHQWFCDLKVKKSLSWKSMMSEEAPGTRQRERTFALLRANPSCFADIVGAMVTAPHI